MPSSESSSDPKEPKSNGKKKKDDDVVPDLQEAIFFDCCSFSQQKMIDLANGTYQDRLQASMLASKASPVLIAQHAPMTLFEEIVSTIFLACGVPVAVFNIPILLWVVGRFVVGNVALMFQLFGVLVLLPLFLLPQKFNPDILQGWMSMCMLKYFSWRYVMEDFPHPDRPRIMVGPPHGVFPYGNLLTVVCHPSLAGIYCRGLAARAAVATPIFKQILRSIGVVDANRLTARRVLEKPSCLGISTGGVAEIFETNNDDEVILLKERVGLIKLAIRTGADLTPCYIFGNTQILSCWAGEGIPGGKNVLQRISRRIGVGLVLIFGRFGLPIPRRVPLLGVVGKAIRTDHMKCEEPTDKQIEEVQELLLKNMQEVFDRYKHLYQWEKKHLIIK